MINRAASACTCMLHRRNITVFRKSKNTLSDKSRKKQHNNKRPKDTDYSQIPRVPADGCTVKDMHFSMVCYAAAQFLVVLSFFANVSLDSDEVYRLTRRLFQVAGPATAKSLRLIVVLVHGTTSAPLFADRSCHLSTTDETGVHTSAKYDGARPWRHLKVIIASLTVIHWQTGNQ